MALIATGNVYLARRSQPIGEGPFLVLIMRRWPRGVVRAAVDWWPRQFGPSDDLLDEWNAKGLAWGDFAARYLRELTLGPRRTDAWDELVTMARGRGVVLLCGSHPAENCHAGLLAGRLAAAVWEEPIP